MSKHIEDAKPKKKRKVLKVIGIMFLAILVIIIGIGVAGYIYLKGLLGHIETVDLDESQLGISEEAEQSLSGYRNIAIFGVDSRQDDYGVGNRSDCIMIASINEKTKDVKLISVYRDTYVKIDGHGYDKITHAYAYGGAQLAINTLNSNLDLNIKDFITVNFDSVAEAVDQLGGIQINIESNEIGYINDYIDATSEIVGKRSKHITKPGIQTLDGVQAVSYSRVRYTAGGDYKRTERMRDVLEAMLSKLKTMSVGEIKKAVETFLDRETLYSSITADEVISMIPGIISYKVVDSIGWPYEVKGITLDKWYGVPVTLESNVVKLHQEQFNSPEYVLPSNIKEISNSIINKTGYR